MSRMFPTSGRGRALLLVGLVLLVSGVVWWRLAGNSGEPSYGGHPLSYWLEEGREEITNPIRFVPFRLSAESTVAVRAIGTNAMPKLREWMTAPKRGWRTKAYAWVQERRLPSVVNKAASSFSGYGHYDPLRSILALEVLGRDAAVAVPFLIEMLQQEENIFMAVTVLCVIQPEGFNALIETFPKIGDEEQRAGILSAMEYVVTPEIEPTLANFTAKWVVEDPHAAVRMMAAQVMGTFQRSAAVVVPALTKALMDRNDSVRFTACTILRRFGKESASATVALRSALSDSNPQVRTNALRALQAIGAPQLD